MAEPATAKLTVIVTNIAEHKGSLMIGVYDKGGYATDKQVAGGAVAVSADTVTTTFDLPAGQYGIKMFHDVDGDGKMSTNPFGMPTEPFAFRTTPRPSSDPRSGMRPPSRLRPPPRPRPSS